MWYAIDMDNGVIYEEKSKRDILLKGYKTKEKICSGGYYAVGCCEDGTDYNEIYIYQNKSLAIENGFGWAFDIEKEKWDETLKNIQKRSINNRWEYVKVILFGRSVWIKRNHTRHKLLYG